MGLFTRSAEEKAAKEAERRAQQAAKEAERQAQEERRRAEEFARSPAGQARAAAKAGAQIFQIALPLSETRASVVAMLGAFTNASDHEQSGTLDSIEAEGWRLEHAGYVFRMTGSESRDKFMASGQQQAVSGEIIGIYVFRLVPNHGA